MSIASGPNVVSSGLVLELDAANLKSYSPNVIPNPNDIYGWCGSAGSNSSILSRDTSITPSPSNGIPMKMAVTGNDPYVASYSSSTWNLAPASNGQTWTASCYVRASAATVAGFFIFGANSSGAYIQLNASTVAITTEWTKITLSYTITDPLVAFVQLRLDGPDSGGTGINIWWDGLQLQLGSSATTFNPIPNLNGVNWYDVSGTNNNGTLVSTPVYNSSNLGSFAFNNIATQSSLVQDSATIKPTSVTVSAWVYMSVYNPLGDFDGSYPTIVWKTNDGLSGSQASYGLTLVAGQVPRLTIAPSVIISATVFPLNVWVNLVGTYTAGSGAMILYRNGEVDTTGTGPAAITYTTELLSVGTRTLTGASQYPWNGNISQVTVYNRVLSAAEVAQNYNAVKGRYGL
jgi:hypothetical protein